MKKILLILSLMLVLFLIGCDLHETADNNLQENTQNQQVIENMDTNEIAKDDETKKDILVSPQIDLSQFVTISEILSGECFELSNLEYEKNYTFNLGNVTIGEKVCDLEIQIKKDEQTKEAPFLVKLDDKVVFDSWCDHLSTSIAIYKDYLICTGNYDFSGGIAQIFNNKGEEIYRFGVGSEKLRIENDFVYFSIDYGELIGESDFGMKTFARADYILKEENGIFTMEQINIDMNDIVYSSGI